MQRNSVSRISIIKLMGAYLPTLRRLSFAAVAVVALASAAVAADSPGFGGSGNEHWVGTWGTALHAPDLGVPGLANTGFNNQTLRQIVHTSVGGHKVRVRFSAFGANAVVIGAAHIALDAGGAMIMPMSDRTLTFGGKPSITIPAGALVLSDPVDLEVPALSDLAVSIFVPEDTGPATWHFEARQTLYVSPQGDFTASAAMPVDSTRPRRTWFWLAGVEVVTLPGDRRDCDLRRLDHGWFAVHPRRQQEVARSARPAAHGSSRQPEDGRNEQRNRGKQNPS